VHGAAADDAYKQRILQAAKADRLLRERLIYLGFRADAERVMGAADVVVCSSQFESYGMVNVEAMACGKPVVSTNRGGPRKPVVHGEPGFLVEPGDAGGLAGVITLLRIAVAGEEFKAQPGERRVGNSTFNVRERRPR
jgi:glycosyltransferase involved in cell wall biosynthesis